jgi:hypothetical protein
MRTADDIDDELRRAAQANLGTRYNFSSKLEAIKNYLVFPSWGNLLLMIASTKPTPIPPWRPPRHDVSRSLMPNANPRMSK